MARLSPDQKIRRITNTIRAWEKHAPRTTLWKHSLAEFKASMQPVLAAHARVLEQRKGLRMTIADRNSEADRAMPLVRRIGLSAKGHPDHGPDSDFCEALGYTKEIVRVARIRRGWRKKRQH